jgi:hypothetical protein
VLANPHSRHARDIAVERNGVRRVVSLCFVLLLTGCGAYEQAQQAARRDQQKKSDYLTRKTEQLETLTYLGRWYLQFQNENAKSPADLEELLDSVGNRTEQRTAAAIETTRRLAAGGEIMIDWNIDLAAWQISGQDLSKCRIAWTAKTEVYNVYLDGTGKVHDVLTADFALVQRMTRAPGPATQVSAAKPATTTPRTAPTRSPAPVPLTVNSAPAQFVAELESGEQLRIIRGLGLLLGSPAAQPNKEVSSAILSVMRTGNPALQINGVLALEKWGTAAVVPELEALATKSGNLGLQIQAKRIVPILKSRK